MQEFQTLPQLLNSVLQNYHNANALCYKHLGEWESISTEKFAEKIRRLSLGLRALGIKKGEGVGIIAASSPQWMMMDLAIQINGALCVPMFPNISTDNFDFEVKDANIKHMFIDSDENLEKAIVNRLKSFAKVISYSVHTNGRNTLNYEELMILGDMLSVKEPELYSQMVDSVLPDDIATIIYTSGSTGQPKGVEITHRNLVSQIYAAQKRFPLNASKDKALSVLPLAHVFERMVIYYVISTGIPIYFADDIKKTGDILRELKPTLVTLVPRILEKVYTKMNSKPQEEKGLKKWLLRKALSRLRNSNELSGNFVDQLFDRLVYGKLREALGGNIKYLISGGAALDPKVNRFFLNAKFPVYEGYGLTEASPVLSCNYPNNFKPDTVGLPFPGVEIKIADNGEIIARGPNIMRGYHNNREETNNVIDTQGWLHTGDKGEFDSDGFLKITGRLKELFKTSNGKYVCPVPIENNLVSSGPIIDQAMVIAESKNFVSILLWPDFENLEALAKKLNVSASPQEFIKDPKVLQKVEKLIKRTNSQLNHWEQIQKFQLLSEPLLIESGELTPKMNIRRHIVEKKYDNIIQGFYENINPD